MALYPQPNPHTGNLYNSSYFIGREDQQNDTAAAAVTLLGDYVKTDGSSIMTGNLTTPAIMLFNDGSIFFDDNTSQKSAFTANHRNTIGINSEKLTNVSYDEVEDTTDISGSVRIRKIIFLDDSLNEQANAFTDSLQTDLLNCKFTLTGVSYDSNVSKTTITNLHATTLTTGSFNSSHMTGTTSNVQNQINVHNTILTNFNNTLVAYEYRITNLESADLKNTDITFDPVLLRTTIGNNTHINSLTCGNISTPHLSGTTSNVQGQINSLNTKTQNISSIYNKTTITGQLLFNSDDDGVYQSTAYTNADQSAIYVSTNKLTRLTYNAGSNTTTIAGNTNCNSLTCGSITMNGQVQNAAYTDDDKLTLSMTQTKVTQFDYNPSTSTTYIGGDVNISSLTCGNCVLSDIAVNKSAIAILNQKTANISTDHALFVNQGTLTIPNIAVQTITMNGTVQNNPFRDADLNWLYTPMVDNNKSNLATYSTNIALSASGGAFINGSKSSFLISLNTGLHTISGVLSILNPNSVKTFKYRLRHVGNVPSPYVGLNFDTEYNTYGDFMFPITWTVKMVVGGDVYLDIIYNYRPNSDMTSIFDFQVLTMY